MINKLKLHNAFIHKEKEIDFSTGINAIVGKNRKGKSSICEAITYGYHGKLNKSTIDKIINDEEEQATVDIEDTQHKFQRIRKKGTSRLKGITASELQDNINLSFKEYMDMFYLGSHENYSLFDASYLRNFLISIFDLDIYKKTYDRLRVEQNTIKALKDNAANYKEVDKKEYTEKFKLYKEHYKLIKEKTSRIKEHIIGLNKQKDIVFEGYREDQHQVDKARRKQDLINRDKCPTCERAFTLQYKNKELSEWKEIEILASLNSEKSLKRSNIFNEKIEEYTHKLDALQEKELKLYGALQKLKYALEQKKPKYDIQRLKELDEILPIFAYTGFPTYMLQKYIPSIQITANSLLQTVFPDISININTQTERNTLALKVEITKNNFSMNLMDCCGSETVLINLCLRLAVIAVFKQFKKTSIDFIIIDEALDKFDDETVLSMVDLFKHFIDMGFINQVILVTHKQSLKDLEGVNYVTL